MSYAADYYISATGNDTSGDGTEGLPWASFSKAQSVAASGSIIHVSGMIDMWSDPSNTTYTLTASGVYSTTNKTGITLAKSLTIQGTSSSTDGFQGKNGTNTTRFFQVANAAYTLTLKNLKLVNGAIATPYATITKGGGAILLTTGNIVAENVLFDGNSATGHNAIMGGAIYITNTNTSGTSFKNCTFSNNAADKSGAFYIETFAAGTASVPSVLKFEGCSFIANESRLAFGGSAIFMRCTNDYTTLSMINCTIAKNKVLNAANGGAVYIYSGKTNTMINIINCTITENTTTGSTGNGAGFYYLNTTAGCWGNLYISNSIIEGNTATGGAYNDLNVSAASPTTAGGGSASVAGYIKIQNSIIGAVPTDPLRVPAATNIVASPQYNYLTSTSTTNALKANFAPFNSTTNSYPLYTGSTAIGYGNSTYLTGLTPPVTTDQLGNVRTVGATNYAGAWESTPVSTTTPSAPTALVATAGDGQVSVAFKSGATGGSNVTNYKYSVNGGFFTALDPAVTAGPIVITGLDNNTEYTVKLIAVNANGDSPESVVSNAVTPTGTTALNNPTNAVSIFKNANNQLVINNASQKAGTVTVYNAMGQRVASVVLNASTTTINKSFTSGVYVVELNIAGNTRSTKIIL